MMNRLERPIFLDKTLPAAHVRQMVPPRGDVFFGSWRQLHGISRGEICPSSSWSLPCFPALWALFEAIFSGQSPTWAWFYMAFRTGVPLIVIQFKYLGGHFTEPSALYYL
jgi:hypothetical protein